MTTVEGSVEDLARAILNEARAEGDELLGQARSKAEAIRRQATDAVEQERQEILETANQEVRRIRSQAAASAQLKARALELEHREKMLSMVFEKAAERLADVSKTPQYRGLVLRLAREALAQLNSEAAVLLADPAARQVLERDGRDLLVKDEGAGEIRSDSLEKGIGVVARTPDGRLQFDNTLETRLKRMQDSLRSSVFRILMGEEQ